VTAELRLAEIVGALEAVGLSCLVMGGHAVCFYGLHRHTDDFDFCLAPDHWEDLPHFLAKSSLNGHQPLPEGASWRAKSFRRFELGKLADGREEWLEFWRDNHLLDPFGELFARREIGEYGGRNISFLSLPDLIRSKETERDKDWHDIERLEEFLDARNLSQVKQGRLSIVLALSQCRSRRGIESFWQAGHLSASEAVESAIELATCPITVAALLPFAPAARILKAQLYEPVVETRLRRTQPLQTVHLALFEAVRRRYREAASLKDKEDKSAIRRAQLRSSE
jgi:hypothetical protein